VSGSDAEKRLAGEAALDREVRTGMRLGLGTGSTAALMLDALAERLADGRLRDVTGVPTSEATAERCRQLGIPLATLAELPELDLAIDGADEIDPSLRLIKGLGGSHLREKVVACAAARFVVIADASKLVRRLGDHAPLPVEVIPFARPVAARLLEGLGWSPELRLRDDAPYVTDEGNHILDCRRDDWSDPERLAAELEAVPGVVEHGLFLGIARAAYVAETGGVLMLGDAAPASPGAVP
jgi:ribose 5-phosphate isomerase A